MENILPIHLQEIIFSSSDSAISQQISKFEKEGKLRKIASRIYTSNLVEEPETIVMRNLFQILGHLYPEAVLSHRSAFEYKPTSTGNIFLTYTYTKKIKLPGVTISFLKGHGPMQGDNPIAGKLFVSQQARALLENMQVSKRPGPDSKTLTFPEIEDKLEQVIRVHGDESLNEIRDKARAISQELDMADEFEKLNRLIGALLTTKPAKTLKSPLAIARAFGLPYDPARIALFEKLFRELNQHEYPNYPDKNTTLNSFRNFAFYESYFSNYIEGTIFELDDAKKIIATQKPMPARNEDSHDVLGTYQLVSNQTEMNITPNSPEELLDMLLYRHKVLLSARQDKNPGKFKDVNNRAGSTHFVDFNLVRGTLSRGFEYYPGLSHPFAKAVYMMFLISEVHPFLDGNGRIARVMMNAELVKEKQSKIIIPTVFRDDYMGALKKLTKQGDALTFIRMMQRAYEFSKNIYWENMDDMEKHLEECDAFKEHKEGKLKITGRLTGTGNDLLYTFSETENSVIFKLNNPNDFVIIKQIRLNPKFPVSTPNDWSRVMLTQNLRLNIKGIGHNKVTRSQSFSVDQFNDPNYRQPDFILNNPIHIPLNVWGQTPENNEFPIMVAIDLTCGEPSLKFDVSLVYDSQL